MVRTVLANGLTVLIRTSRTAPVVAVVTSVNAGYFDEEDDEVGISHVLEHMYFKGTPSFGVGEIARETQAAGGYLNAHTTYDHTSYEVVVPADGFARALSIQADAFANPLLDGEELAREIEVIIQEAGRKRDSPSAVAIESLHALLHDHHRIRRWRIGEDAGLRALTSARLRSFHQRYYRPGNTILSVVGAVEFDEVLRQAELCYGHLTDATVHRNDAPGETGPPGFRVRDMDADIELAEVVMGWRTPGATHPDTPALDMAATILGHGRGSRLYRAVREKRLASRVDTTNYTPRDVGVFSVRSEGDPQSAAAAAASCWAEIRSLAEVPPARQELERAQRLFEARWLRSQETVEGQAGRLAAWEALGGWQLMSVYFDRMMSLKPGEVRDTVARYLDPDQASVLACRPRNSAVFPAPSADGIRRLLDAGRSEPVRDSASLSPPPVIRRHHAEFEGVVAGVSVFRTAKGLPILVRRQPGAPLVHLGVVTTEGAAAESDQIAGMATVLARASVKGTPGRDAAAIANESELLGGSVVASATNDAITWTMAVLPPRLREAVALLRDIVQQPVFPDPAIETERAVALSQLAQLRDDMFRYPIRLATSAAFGPHPYGRSVLGSRESLEVLTPERVREWHASHVLRSGGVVAATGDTPEEELAEALAAGFSELGTGPVVLPPSPSWPDGMVTNAETREKSQSALAMAFPGPRRSDSSRHAASLLSRVASGLSGRFFRELRDRRSLAYTVQTMSLQRAAAGLFIAYVATSPEREDEARAVLLEEIDRFRAEPVTQEELERVKRYSIGSWHIARQSAATVLSDMADAWLFGVGLEEPARYESAIEAVSADEIRAFAASSLDGGRRVEGIVRGAGRQA